MIWHVAVVGAFCGGYAVASIDVYALLYRFFVELSTIRSPLALFVAIVSILVSFLLIFLPMRRLALSESTRNSHPLYAFDDRRSFMADTIKLSRDSFAYDLLEPDRSVHIKRIAQQLLE